MHRVYTKQPKKKTVNVSVLLPVDALDPSAQILSDVHGEGVVIQLVHLLQVFAVQHLKLAPLRHRLVNNNNNNKSSFIKYS